MAQIPHVHSKTVQAIYDHHAKRKSGTFDSYGLTFSGLGEECDRALWYGHHWVFPQTPPSGEKARLFDTGDREEARIIAELRAVGVQITDEQEKQKLCDGHLRGKIECEALGLPDAPKTPHVVEIKTHKNTNFNAILKHGLKVKFPKHYIQLMLGVHAKGRNRGIYIMNCKNGGADGFDLCSLRFELNPLEVAEWLARAERIIHASTPPSKLHDDPEKKAAFKCKMCPARHVCHEGAWPRINCRTCLHSSPGANGSWVCAHHGGAIDRDLQKTGCRDHRLIPDLVPGVQVDVEAEPLRIHYALHDGASWIDEGRPELGDYAPPAPFPPPRPAPPAPEVIRKPRRKRKASALAPASPENFNSHPNDCGW